MRIKKGYLLRELAGEIIVVPTTDDTLNFNGIITLNETSAFLWKLLEQETTKEALVASLMNEYEVKEEIAHRDVKAFLSKLHEEQFLE